MSQTSEKESESNLYKMKKNDLAQFSKECAARQRSVSSIMPHSSEVLKNMNKKLTKVVVEVELRYRVVVTNSAM